MLAIHLLDGQNVLLALTTQNLVLPDQQLNQFVNRFDFFNADDRQIFNEQPQFLLLRKETRVLEIGRQSVTPVLALVATNLEIINRMFFLQHYKFKSRLTFEANKRRNKQIVAKIYLCNI
jgi:hypothetical protein